MKKVRNEKDLWADLNKFMGARWRPQRHDDRSMGGDVPDVSFIMKSHKASHETGWMELKVWMPNDVNYKLRHFTDGQRDWLHEHDQLDVPVFVLLDLQVEYLLIYGSEIQKIGCVSPEQLVPIWKNAKFDHSLVNQLSIHTIKV